MARQFDGTADYLTTNSQDTVFAVQPFSGIIWFKVDAQPNGDETLIGRAVDSADQCQVWINNPPSEGKLTMSVKVSSVSETIATSNTVDTSYPTKWHCGYFHSDTTDHKVVLDGDTASAGTSTTSKTLASMTGKETEVAQMLLAEYGQHTIGLIALWDELLSDDQIRALARGVHPTDIGVRPSHLWDRGFDKTGNVWDEIGSATLEEFSAPSLAADGPPVDQQTPHLLSGPIPSVTSTTHQAAATINGIGTLPTADLHISVYAVTATVNGIGTLPTADLHISVYAVAATLVGIGDLEGSEVGASPKLAIIMAVGDTVNGVGTLPTADLHISVYAITATADGIGTLPTADLHISIYAVTATADGVGTLPTADLTIVSGVLAISATDILGKGDITGVAGEGTFPILGIISPVATECVGIGTILADPRDDFNRFWRAAPDSPYDNPLFRPLDPRFIR